jgi:hypothetical protein
MFFCSRSQFKIEPALIAFPIRPALVISCPFYLHRTPVFRSNSPDLLQPWQHRAAAAEISNGRL